MGDIQFTASFLDQVDEYIKGLPVPEQGLIAAHITELELGNFQSVLTKKLRGPIRELIVRHHRLIYFTVGKKLYFASGFRKKSRKTPKKEIDYAEKIYTMIKQN